MNETETTPDAGTTEARLDIPQTFTHGTDPFDEVEWELRDAFIPPKFEQKGVSFPKDWSQNATNIVASKYFHGKQGTPGREYSVKQLIGRVAERIARAGRLVQDDSGLPYFATDEEARTFEHELKHILVHQKASFNSPVWFNIGLADQGVTEQCSACFILSVDDRMEDILDWYKREGLIFKNGSGAGTNLSKVRASSELLSGGGRASGPVTFMRGADSSAGTITSGGRTRRAAKMVVLDVDHPDIRQFIWCKKREEDKARALQDAGYDMSLNSDEGAENWASLQYQNANNSVRVTDEFMRAVENDDDWHLISRTSGDVVETVPARQLFGEICEAAWHCADPGIQFDTTINDWHTCPNFDRINSSNPCSEYMHVDDSSCNLASLNLMKFRLEDGSFDVDAFRHAARVMFTAQEILISFAYYPGDDSDDTRIGDNTRAMRQIGLGYANLGAYLMSLGLPYDSDEGRAIAAAITALMTGESYRQSAIIARRMGPFAEYQANEDAMLRVLRKHRAASRQLPAVAADPALVKAAKKTWSEAVKLAEQHGVRNAQATVLAPTGTISFMMDCDTTGIEPDFSLKKHKLLAGGGNMTIVNQTVAPALSRLGYGGQEIREILEHIDEHNTILGAPHVSEDHYPVFATSTGENAIAYMGHVRMMASVQPFISGAISKTANMEHEATVADVEELYMQSWRMGIKALAMYRDGSKVTQPLSGGKQTAGDPDDEPTLKRGEKVPMPANPRVTGGPFRVGRLEGFIHVHEDVPFDSDVPGRPRRLFVNVAKTGSFLRGMIDTWAVTVSSALRYDTPLEDLVLKLADSSFGEAGFTGDPRVPSARSVVDYVVKWLAYHYCDEETCAELGLTPDRFAEFDADEADQEVAFRVQKKATVAPAPAAAAKPAGKAGTDPCMKCGGVLVKTGTCTSCTQCGDNTGCG